MGILRILLVLGTTITVSACAHKSGSVPTYQPKSDSTRDAFGVRTPLPYNIRLMTSRSTLEKAKLTVEQAIRRAQDAAQDEGYGVDLRLDVAVDYDSRKREWTVIFDPAAISGEYLMVWIKENSRKVQFVRGR